VSTYFPVGAPRAVSSGVTGCTIEERTHSHASAWREEETRRLSAWLLTVLGAATGLLLDNEELKQ